MKKVESNRITTGIKSLDGTVEGGFKRCSVNLLEGGPGAGKSILAMQYLVNGTKLNQPGVYISFEEERANLIDNFKRFGWPLEKLEKEKKLGIVEVTPEDIQHLVQNESFGLKFEIVKHIHAQRIVIDSLNAYIVLFEEGLQRRKALHTLFKLLRDFKCTSLIISEREIMVQHNVMATDSVEFSVDSIISLYNLRRGDVRERALEVRKMRGTKITPKMFPMQISDEGIDIFPNQTMFWI
jgi:circadian clock protein KaiC